MYRVFGLNPKQVFLNSPLWLLEYEIEEKILIIKSENIYNISIFLTSFAVYVIILKFIAFYTHLLLLDNISVSQKSWLQGWVQNPEKFLYGKLNSKNIFV